MTVANYKRKTKTHAISFFKKVTLRRRRDVYGNRFRRKAGKMTKNRIKSIMYGVYPLFFIVCSPYVSAENGPDYLIAAGTNIRCQI